MRLENLKLNLAPLNLEQIRIDGYIVGFQGKKSLRLEGKQFEFLSLLCRGYTIHEIAHHFFAKGIFISFVSLHQLLEFLVCERIATNPEARRYFEPDFEPPAGLLENLVNQVFGTVEAPIHVKQELKSLPFFRTLKPQIFAQLFSQAKIIEVPAKTVICQAGQSQRCLFVLLRGQASVFSNDAQGKRQNLATLAEGSVFGEVGYFLGKPRTADVITSQKSLIVQIDYENSSGLVQIEKAKELQQRLWLVHALLKSDFFNDIPSDCFDALVFAGKMRKFTKDMWLCQEGRLGSACYIIVKGSAVVSQQSKAIGRMAQGDCFGEVALTMTGGRRSASVHSETEVMALEIQAQGFYKLLAGNLMLACKFESMALNRLNVDRSRQPA